MRKSATTARRKRSAPNRKTKPRIEEVEASELSPLDHMLAVMRNPKTKPARRDAMAVAAAMYVHPPIAPLDISNLRTMGRLLAESMKSDASPTKREA